MLSVSLLNRLLPASGKKECDRMVSDVSGIKGRSLEAFFGLFFMTGTLYSVEVSGQGLD